MACTNASREGIGARGKAARDEWQAKLDAYSKQYPELAREFAQIEAHELPDGWDNDIPDFRCRPEGRRLARLVGQGAQCDCRARSVDDRRRGGSVAVDQNQSEVRRRGQLRGRQLWRPQSAFRHSRARDGRGGERARVVESAAVRFDVPDFQRLHEAANPPLGDHGSAVPFTCSRTIRSASAKTVRPISRSSNWLRCAACRV